MNLKSDYLDQALNLSFFMFELKWLFLSQNTKTTLKSTNQSFKRSPTIVTSQPKSHSHQSGTLFVSTLPPPNCDVTIIWRRSLTRASSADGILKPRESFFGSKKKHNSEAEVKLFFLLQIFFSAFCAEWRTKRSFQLLSFFCWFLSFAKRKLWKQHVLNFRIKRILIKILYQLE